MSTWFTCGIFLFMPLALLACNRTVNQLPLTSQDLAECFSDGASDPWKPDLHSSVVTLIADTGLFATGGLVSNQTGLVAYDREMGIVVLWDLDGRTQTTFGGLGHGPGELAAQGGARVYRVPPVSWVDVLEDTVAVLDGLDVSLFTSSGVFLKRLRTFGEALSGVHPFSSKIRRTPGGVIVDIEARIRFDQPRGPHPRRYSLWFLAQDSVSELPGIELDPLPATPRTGIYHGIGEANPLWDLSGSCYVITDGSTSRLFVGRLGRAGLDTVAINLPETGSADPTDSDEEAHNLSELGVRGSVPEPSMPRRVSAMITDPAGWVWLLPTAERGKPVSRILRVALAGGRSTLDSVRVFPVAFGAPGSYHGITTGDSMGIRSVVTVSPRR